MIELRTVRTSDVARWLAAGWRLAATWTGDARWTRIWRAVGAEAAT